jgi:GT2 family glycosyltransferase
MSAVASSQGAPSAPWSPLVSVIVPTHLAEPPYLGETLASVVGQEWASWEVIVVDDGSAAPTETLDKLTSVDARISLLRAPKGGLSRARNLGLEHARGELVAFLDSDDYWYPPHLSCAVRTLAQHEEAVATYSAIAVVLGTQRVPFEVDHESGPTDRRTALSGGNRPFIPSLVARRQVVEAVGGFDPQFDGAEDKDLIFKLLEKGPCLYVNAVTVAYRHHDQNVSLDVIRSSRARDRVLAAHRARALAAGDTKVVADIALGLSRARRYDAGVAVSKALAATKSGDFRKAAALVAWSLRCSPSQAVLTAGQRAWKKLLSRRRPSTAPPQAERPAR